LDRLVDEFTKLTKNVASTTLRAFAHYTRKALKLASKSLYIEAELGAGFDYQDDKLVAFVKFLFKVRLFGMEFQFQIEWKGNLDEFIDMVIKSIIKFLRKNLTKVNKWAKKSLKNVGQKVINRLGKLGSTKLLTGVPKEDILELEKDLDTIEKEPELVEYLAANPGPEIVLNTREIPETQVQLEEAAEEAVTIGGFGPDGTVNTDFIVVEPPSLKSTFSNIFSGFKEISKKAKEKKRKKLDEEAKKREEKYKDKLAKEKKSNAEKNINSALEWVKSLGIPHSQAEIEKEYDTEEKIDQEIEQKKLEEEKERKRQEKALREKEKAEKQRKIQEEKARQKELEQKRKDEQKQEKEAHEQEYQLQLEKKKRGTQAEGIGTCRNRAPNGTKISSRETKTERGKRA